MKTYLSTLIAILLTGVISISAYSQDKKTETVEFEVKGVCDMCKDRIENASLIKGVKFTEYTVDTQTLKVVYRKDKTTLDKIHASIAKAGHTTSKVKANPDAYNKLPSCCQYADPNNPHLQNSHKGHNH